jgi:hypothetical protein
MSIVLNDAEGREIIVNVDQITYVYEDYILRDYVKKRVHVIQFGRDRCDQIFDDEYEKLKAFMEEYTNLSLTVLRAKAGVLSDGVNL